MMGFTMHYYKKFNHLLIEGVVVLAILLLTVTHVHASTNSLLIKSADLTQVDDEYWLSANVDVKFSEEVEQTLQKGFDLNFILEFQLALPRKYWFDDEIITITQPITLSYHPLSRQYLMTQAGQHKSFANLNGVIREFSSLQPIKVIKKNEIEKGEPYKALLLIRLDYKKLPKALQDDVEDLSAWQMTSQRYEWVPVISK
jgi:hypothetical protein